MENERNTQTLRTKQLSLPLDPKEQVVSDWRASVPTVTQLTRRIRGSLESTFPETWVKGEISNFRKPVSGHAYFILKDAGAQMKAVLFRPVLSRLKFELKDGLEILLHGKITVYEARGEYQLVCDAAEPVGVGALQLAFEQLKARLHKEGLFDAVHKKPLPHLPTRIGVVTSATGAAVRDILKVLSRRFPNRRIVILPAAVQGEKAAADIANAIAQAERWNVERPDDRIEVLIVGRGGGSLEDLWPFNEEKVARAIFQCTIPIISAVGHEIDFTIADFVADLRAPTPSAAAEIVVPRHEELQYQVKSLHNRVSVLVRRRVEQIKLHLTHLSSRLVDPRARIKQIRQHFETLNHRLNQAMQLKLRVARHKLEICGHKLDTLSPLSCLGRGYSITMSQEGSIIKRVGELSPGKIVKTRLSDGFVESQVLSLTENEATSNPDTPSGL